MTHSTDIIIPVAAVCFTSMDFIHDALEEKPLPLGTCFLGSLLKTIMYGTLFGGMYNFADKAVCGCNTNLVKTVVGITIMGIGINQFSHLIKHKKIVFPSITLPTIKIEYQD